jgi:hypothetical protein
MVSIGNSRTYIILYQERQFRFSKFASTNKKGKKDFLRDEILKIQNIYKKINVL